MQYSSLGRTHTFVTSKVNRDYMFSNVTVAIVFKAVLSKIVA